MHGIIKKYKLKPEITVKKNVGEKGSG